MISAIKWTESSGTLPYRNLALEKHLLMQAEPGECILFLWQNRKTVVIGRNQNAWAECRIKLLQKDHGYLARRLSGGGAVFHDLGNLNFSFLVRREDYSPERQTDVILRAVRALGIPAGKTGRNDLECEGRKFSGHAFFETKGGCCHHGTLMMDVNLEDMTRYLSASPAKLQSRGVPSVRARVVNLKERCPGLDRSLLTESLVQAFSEVFGLPAEPLDPSRLKESDIRREEEKLASPEWLLTPRIPFSAGYEARFPWGGIQLMLSVRMGQVREAVCWSDAMEEQLIRRIGESLAGCTYDGEALAARVLACPVPEELSPERRDLQRKMLSDVAGTVRQQTDGNLSEGEILYEGI